MSSTSSSALVGAGCGSRAALALVHVYIATINSFDDVNAWLSRKTTDGATNWVRLPARAHMHMFIPAGDHSMEPNHFHAKFCMAERMLEWWILYMYGYRELSL